MWATHLTSMICLMERVTGIGGLFIRARDPERLTQWYRDNLGIDEPPETYETSSWRQEAGPTVFAPMPEDSTHFGSTSSQWSLNLRVRDLDAMVAQLREAGIVVTVDPEAYPNGRFAELRDPEDNPIQLWEPSGADDPER